MLKGRSSIRITREVRLCSKHSQEHSWKYTMPACQQYCFLDMETLVSLVISLHFLCIFQIKKKTSLKWENKQLTLIWKLANYRHHNFFLPLLPRAELTCWKFPLVDKGWWENSSELGKSKYHRHTGYLIESRRLAPRAVKACLARYCLGIFMFYPHMVSVFSISIPWLYLPSYSLTPSEEYRQWAPQFRSPAGKLWFLWQFWPRKEI